MDVYEEKLLNQFTESKKEIPVEHVECNGFTMEEMESFNPEDNFFSQDVFHMAQTLGMNVLAMFCNHSKEDMKYLILVDIKTGRRIKIRMPGFTK